jgi:hypothetical protein
VFTVSLVHAETSIPKPDVPTFTARLIDNSYDVPTTYTTDPCTGRLVTNLSHQVDNKTVEVKINNQPFTPTTVDGLGKTSFVFNVRVKGHFAKDWINFYMMGEGPTPSNTDSTVISYQLIPTQPDQGYTLESLDRNISSNSISELPPNSQIDFQVEAMIGYWSRTTEFNSMHFTAQESGWSSSQTVTIPGNAATATSNTSASPTQAIPTINTGPIIKTYLGLNYGEIIIIAILSVIVVLLVILIAVFQRKKVK